MTDVGWWVFVALAVAGGLGAACRLFVDGLIRSRWSTRLPLGTIVINLSGSLALGLITGLVVADLAPAPWRLIVGSGFLGGYTTFSSASVEAVRLVAERAWAAALVNVLGVLVAGTALAGLGLVVGLSL